MADPKGMTEIEDVLSSIRRLVAAETRKPEDVAPMPAEPVAQALVLTPAQRVDSETGAETVAETVAETGGDYLSETAATDTPLAAEPPVSDTLKDWEEDSQAERSGATDPADSIEATLAELEAALDDDLAEEDEVAGDAWQPPEAALPQDLSLAEEEPGAAPDWAQPGDAPEATSADLFPEPLAGPEWDAPALDEAPEAAPTGLAPFDLPEEEPEAAADPEAMIEAPPSAEFSLLPETGEAGAAMPWPDLEQGAEAALDAEPGPEAGYLPQETEAQDEAAPDLPSGGPLSADKGFLLTEPEGPDAETPSDKEPRRGFIWVGGFDEGASSAPSPGIADHDLPAAPETAADAGLDEAAPANPWDVELAESAALPEMPAELAPEMPAEMPEETPDVGAEAEEALAPAFEPASEAAPEPAPADLSADWPTDLDEVSEAQPEVPEPFEPDREHATAWAEDDLLPPIAAGAEAAEADMPGLFDAGEDLPFDEAALRDLVAEIIRDELRGALGERIGRNLRKLVRQEIEAALARQGGGSPG